MVEFSVTTGRDGSRTFSEHDDRWDNGNQRGRGRGYRGNQRKFRSGRGSYRRGGGYRGGGSYNDRGQGSYGDRSNYGDKGSGGYRDLDNPNPRSRLDGEGDDTMGDEGEERPQKQRYNPYGRPSRGSRGRRYNSSSRGSSGHSTSTYQRLGLPVTPKEPGEMEWFKVLIPWGSKADKDFILKNITSRTSVPFTPTYFHYEDKSAVFYVNDRDAANDIRSLSKQIEMPNKYRMTILVKESYPPNIPMGPEEIEKIKVCMSNRYDPPTKILNLNSLYTDKELSQNNLYVNLARPQVMNNVVKIIEENIPELVGLILSKNKLDRLDHLANLVSKTPDVKMLDLSENKIVHIEEVRKISTWKLESLKLDGNPLCDRFKEKTSYVSAVRKMFPKVQRLDGNDLPPPITFDIEARTDLPKAKDSFFPSADVQATIVRFLKEYFTVYDSDNRSGLAGAYHDTASFSLASAYNGASQQKQVSLSSYIEESRNLIRTNNKDYNRKFKLLKKGNHIIPQLCLLPKTQHDLNSLTVDTSLVSPTMICFNVQGVFKEVTKTDRPPVRAFSRTFVTVPGGHSMLIINDMLTITNASQDQIQSAFKNPAPTPSSSPVPQTSPLREWSAFKNPAPTPSSSPVPQTSPTNNPFEGVSGFTQEQQQMIASFMNDSGMNSKFSADCLRENGWDYSKAGQIFLDLQKHGKIPAEAFIKDGT